MTRRRVTLLALLAAGLAAIAGTLTGRWRSPGQSATDQPAFSLSIDSRDLDLGEVWEQDRLVRRIKVYSRGSEPARVTTLAGSCACVGPGSVSEVIPPGQSREIPIELDLRQDCAMRASTEVRAAQVRLPIVVEPMTAQQEWVVRGQVRTALVVPVRAIDFGRLSANSQPTTRVIPIRTFSDRIQPTVSVDHPGIVAELKPTAKPRGWELVVSPARSLPAGHYSAVVELNPAASSGEAIPPVRIPVEFDLLGDVQPDTPTVVLGTRRVGEVAEETITLTSLSGRPFRVEKWSTDVPGETEVHPKDTGGAAQVFTCRQRVTATGHQATGLKFTGTDADGKPFVAAVAVRYYGVPAP